MSSLLMEVLLGPDQVPIGNCAWIYTFDNDDRNYYHQGLVITGFISQILTLWLNLTLMLTTLWKDDDYNHFAIFTIAACLRKVAAGLVSLPSHRYIDSWFASNLVTCIMLAYHDCFLSGLEIEGLTNVCIGRYVTAKYAAKGWPMNKLFYYLYVFSTLLFAFCFTYIPILGIAGSFYYDFSCTTCTYEMILPDGNERFLVLILFFMRSIKPALVMMISLTLAYYLDKNVCTDREAGKRMIFTRNMMTITAVTLLSWLPLGLIRGYVIIGQLFYDKTDIIESMEGLGAPIKWAMLLNWISPALMVITLMLVDENVRHNMFNLFSAARTAAELANREAEKEEKQRLNEREKQKGKKKQ